MSTTTEQKMDSIYKNQVKFYDFLRKFYLLGRVKCIKNLKLKNEIICEIGCGTGSNLIEIAKKYPTVSCYGLEASHIMASYAVIKIFKNHLQERVIIKKGLAQDLKTADLTMNKVFQFDRILFFYSLSMIPEYELVLLKALENLKAGGSLHIVDFSNHDGLPHVIKKIHFKWLSLFSVYPQPGIVNYLMRKEREGVGKCVVNFSKFNYYETITFIKR